MRVGVDLACQGRRNLQHLEMLGVPDTHEACSCRTGESCRRRADRNRFPVVFNREGNGGLFRRYGRHRVLVRFFHVQRIDQPSGGDVRQTDTVADALSGPRDLDEARTEIQELQTQLEALERENEELRELHAK